MKKYLLGIMAIALAIGFSAFTNDSNKTQGQSTTNYRWAKTTSSGSIVMPVEIFDGSAEDARDEFLCPAGTPNYCAKAVDEDNVPLPGGPELRRN